MLARHRVGWFCLALMGRLSASSLPARGAESPRLWVAARGGDTECAAAVGAALEAPLGALPADGAWRALLAVRSDGEVHTARLELLGGTEEFERELTAADCRELGAALALSLRVFADQARAAAAPTPTDALASAPTASEGVSTSSTPAPREARPRGAPPAAAFIGAGARVGIGLLPGVSGGAVVSAGVPWAPAFDLRVQVAYDASAPVTTETGRYELSATSFALGVGWTPYRTERLSLPFFGALEGTVTHAVSYSAPTVAPVRQGSGGLLLGTALRVRLVGGLLLAPELQARLTAFGARYTDASGAEVWAQPPVSASAGLSLIWSPLFRPTR